MQRFHYSACNPEYGQSEFSGAGEVGVLAFRATTLYTMYACWKLFTESHGNASSAFVSASLLRTGVGLFFFFLISWVYYPNVFKLCSLQSDIGIGFHY
jgi:hypothetical protein